MAPRRRTTPRKTPRQDRARFTVDAILEAAAYILARDGWDRLTTNRVAERAGVNIASLYQYFPNKESIVAELQRRHRTRIRQASPDIRPALAAPRDLRGRLRALVDAAVREHRVEPALHRMFEDLPRSVRRHDAADEEHERRFWRTLIRPFLKNVPDPDLAVFLCRAAGHAAIHEAVIERPDLLEHPHFADEVTTLLVRYLRRPRRPS